MVVCRRLVRLHLLLHSYPPAGKCFVASGAPATVLLLLLLLLWMVRRWPHSSPGAANPLSAARAFDLLLDAAMEIGKCCVCMLAHISEGRGPPMNKNTHSVLGGKGAPKNISKKRRIFFILHARDKNCQFF